ncbi:hypothetical protein ABZ990_00395 [Streptomyces sp. NPDC046203]|uniref:hypothetical protein n=1 Tax=Streptomyces sp. NPDC046203 TaxID=3154602 RepID=UPI0033EDE432
MTEDEWLDRHGLHPAGADLDEVRRLLVERTRLEEEEQGDGDTRLVKLCCVQLFHAGMLDDVPLIWEAKTASMDAGCSIDVQLLCGGGLEATKRYLRSRCAPGAGTPGAEASTDEVSAGSASAADAEHALERLLDCERAGDFQDFTVEGRSAWYTASYAS